MADNDTNPRPMSDADITPPPGDTSFQPAVPLKDQGVEFEPATGGTSSSFGGGSSGSSSFGSGSLGSAGDSGSLGGGSGNSSGSGSGSGSGGGGATGVRQQLTDNAGKLQAQAGDKAREFAKMGQDRAASALDQLATMLTDAAGQVDAKLGAQYGGYARNAAETVQKFSGQIRDQDFDQLLDQGRELVRKSPAVAIGAAAAVGFVVARLVQSGIDADRA